MSEVNEQAGEGGASTRREFFRSTVRYAALTALLVGSGGLVFRKDSGKCEREIPCGGCALFAGCGLPQAEVARQSESQLTRGPEGRG